jgi:hypothetical protein
MSPSGETSKVLKKVWAYAPKDFVAVARTADLKVEKEVKDQDSSWASEQSKAISDGAGSLLHIDHLWNARMAKIARFGEGPRAIHFELFHGDAYYLPPLCMHTFKTEGEGEICVGSVTWHPIVDGTMTLVSDLKTEVEKKNIAKSFWRTLSKETYTDYGNLEEHITERSNCGPPLLYSPADSSAAAAGSSGSK